LHQQKVSIMGQMAAGMAHEIRNPITSIKGFIHLMREQNQHLHYDSKTWEHYFSICEDEMDSIEMLVSDFLLLSKKNQQANNDVELYNLNVIFKRLEPFCHFYALQKKANLQFEIPKEDVLAFMNAQYMEQVCLNIIRNAIDAVAVHGNVSLSC